MELVEPLPTIRALLELVKPLPTFRALLELLELVKPCCRSGARRETV